MTPQLENKGTNHTSGLAATAGAGGAPRAAGRSAAHGSHPAGNLAPVKAAVFSTAILSHFARAAAVLAMLVLAQPAAVSAAIIAEDPISYPPDTNSIKGLAGGTGWGGGWLGPVNSSDHVTVVDVTAKPLAFTPAGGAPIGGGSTALECRGPSSSVQTARKLAAPLTNTFYVAWLVRYDNANQPPQANFDHYNTFSLFLAGTNNDTHQFNFGMRAGEETTFMARNGTGEPPEGGYVSQQFLPGVTHLMVARLVYSKGRFHHLDAWLDPAYAASGMPTVSVIGGTLPAVSHIFFRSARGDADDRYRFTHLVIGTTWDDVVPPAAP